ncbi:MAG: Smr/MutS family protein [Solobacterium sp.]|nr:Smr/MutS family protein [Solobacterium sp.]
MSLEKSLELDTIIEETEKLCSFSLGAERIRNTLPSYDPLIIKRDNERIRDALQCTVKYGPMPFYGIRDIGKALDNAERSRTLTVQELMDVMMFIRGLRYVLSYEKSIEIPHEAVKELTGTLLLHGSTEKAIGTAINDYGEIVDEASAELRQIRRDLRSVDQQISAAVQRFLASNAESVVDGIVTYRGNRAVILVKAQDKNRFGGMIYGDSASGQASYVEPASLIPVNNRKQELISREQEEIERILRALSLLVKNDAVEERANLETVSILDALFAKAQWGLEHDACAAQLTEERSLILKQARHPLIARELVVANDYHLQEPRTMLLITGPNTGGKTVSMKIIGLFVLLTYCGYPVTADEAQIPFFDRVFADIGDDQSVAASLSSFSAHVRKLSEVIREATSKSLALLDEIGSGTDPKEGESLAIAIMNELRQRKTMTVATTHYSRLKSYGKRHEDILVASVQFDMDELKPTYRFIEGIAGRSNALEVAARWGLPSSIINYARFLRNQAQTEEDELIERLEQQLNENYEKERLLNEKLAEIEEKEKQLVHKEHLLDYEKETLQEKTRQEADAWLNSVREEAEAILAEMRRKQESGKYHEVLEERKKLPVIKEEDTEHEDGEYAVGDVVELYGSTTPATVREVRKKDLVIELNGRQMRVKPSQIHHSLKKMPGKQRAASLNVAGSSMFDTMPLECNLIGMRVDEAMDTMAAYMDEAKIHGLNTFRIIHGDGTGALRKAVHKALAADHSVESYHLGMPKEGGTGATIVVMK